LRASAVLVAFATFVGSGAYVIAHPKNDAAPLQPPAATQLARRTPLPNTTPSSTRAARATPTPRITLAPGVQATQLPGITYTHVS
jgi:hypothetical protein